jgi:hypothetical protein
MHHVGSCRKLIQALDQLLPEKFSKIAQIHHEGDRNICFESIIEELVKIAVSESHSAQEYAAVCEQISELFLTIDSSNPFKYLLNNHLQKWFTTSR